MAEGCGLQAAGCGLQGNRIQGSLVGGLEMLAWIYLEQLNPRGGFKVV